jgi:phage host-nuclease inhibitor protein Gam
MTRTKSKATLLQNESEAQSVLARYIVCDNELRTAQIERDHIVAAANERFASTKAQITPIASALVKELHRYFDAHRDDLLKSRKSIDWQDTTIGYRTGTPKLKFTSNSEEEIIDDFADDEWLDALVRTRRELDKQAIIKLLIAKEPLESDLAETLAIIQGHGMTIEQRETFFIDRPDMATAGETA